MNKKTVILYSIIIIGIIYIILLFSGVISFKNNNETINNGGSNISIIDEKVENKEEILKIIGLTEKGYRRLSDDLKTQYNLSGDNYIDYNTYDIAKIFIDLSAGEYQVKDIDKESLNKLIFNYASENGIEIENVELNGNKNHPCYNDGGCSGIREENYKLIASVYNLSENPSDVLQKYGDLYVIKSFGTVDNPHEINDSITIKNVNDGVEVKYSVRLKKIEDKIPNGVDFNKNIIFTLKKNPEGKYYLDKIIVEEK